MKYITRVGELQYEVEILDDGRVRVDNNIYDVDFAEISEQRLYSLIIGSRSIEAYVYPEEDGWHVLYEGRSYPAQVEDERERQLRQSAAGDVAGHGEFTLKSPMPGLVVAVPVEEGRQVAKGEVMVVLESMKMQNELKSPRAGVVTRIRVHPGERVEQHAPLLTVADQEA